MVGAKTPTLALSGRVDRIDDVDGELVIVDYKTGRTGLGADDARGSRALALYAFAAERVFRRRCRRVELHHLPTGTVAAHEHTDESIARHVRRAEQTAADAMAAEKQLAAGADPDDGLSRRTPGAICGWCDFRRICPAGAERVGHEPWAGLARSIPGSDRRPVGSRLKIAVIMTWRSQDGVDHDRHGHDRREMAGIWGAGLPRGDAGLRRGPARGKIPET